MKKAKILFLIMGGAVVLLVAAVALSLKMDGGSTEQEPTASAAETAQPPPSATETIAKEFAGQFETAHVNPADLAEPEPSALPTTMELGSRDYEEMVTETFGEEKKTERKVAAVEKTLSLTVDKAASKVSKNLDKKKVMDLLTKKLDKNCQPKLSDNITTLKALISLSKTGTISNIKVTPGTAEKDLAKCMRKKLADAKALKPKNKSVAQITVQFNVK